MTTNYAYGHWSLVIISILLVFFFVSKYIPVRTRLEKRSGGVLATFIVALFTDPLKGELNTIVCQREGHRF